MLSRSSVDSDCEYTPSQARSVVVGVVVVVVLVGVDSAARTGTAPSAASARIAPFTARKRRHAGVLIVFPPVLAWMGSCAGERVLVTTLDGPQRFPGTCPATTSARCASPTAASKPMNVNDLLTLDVADLA